MFVDSVGAWSYRGAVTSQPSGADDAVTPLPKPGATPREIRAALHPEYREDFDRDYRAALEEAGRSLDLSRVHETVESWRRRACVSRDRAAYRRMIRRAAELLEGAPPSADEPTAVTESRL